MGGKHLGEERFNWRKDSFGGRKTFGVGEHLGEERFNWMKAFGGGKHLGEENIWGGNHLG